MSRERSLLRRFIQSGALRGEWYFEVPAGLKFGWEKANQAPNLEEWAEAGKEDRYFNALVNAWTKAIDALCVLEGLNSSGPFTYDFRDYFKAWRGEHPRVSFEGKRVALIEAKSRQMNFEALGQLLTYKELFLNDWPNAKVEVIGIVCTETDELIDWTCRRYGIKTWSYAL